MQNSLRTFCEKIDGSFVHLISSWRSLRVCNRFDRRTFSCITKHTLYLPDILSIYPGITRIVSQLLYECRQAKKKQLITDCWSYDGSIIVKTLTNKILSIKTSSDLKSVSLHTIK